MLIDVLWTPAVSRALVVGLFGGVGLVLTVVYSRRGPMIYPVYAAFLVALAAVISRYAVLPFAARFTAAMAGFVVASALLFAASMFRARVSRQRLRAEGRLPPGSGGPSVLGHAGPVVFLLVVGVVVSAGVAFVAG